MADKQSKAKTDPEAATPEVKHEVRTAVQTEKRFTLGRLFWGLMLITIGGLFLLSNANVIEVDLVAITQLWPLLIVALGLSILSFRSIWWNILMGVFIALSIAAVVWVTVGGGEFNRSTKTDTIAIQKLGDDIQSAHLDIEGGASKMRVNSKEIDEIVKAELVSTRTDLESETDRDGQIQNVGLQLTSDKTWWIGNFKNELTIDVTNKMPLELSIDAGASSLDIDVSSALLRRLDIKAGASSMKIRLGDRENQTNVDIDSGASTITVQVPRQCGIQVNAEGGLSSKNFGDLDKVGENTYQTSEFDTAQKKIFINADIGLASFTIERY